MKVIRTASGIVSLGAYVQAWRRARRAPAGKIFESSLRGWWPATREELLQEFSDGVHDRINRKLPWYRRGRKWSNEWWWDTVRAARELNTPRLRIHWLPAWLKQRFQHRL